MINFVGYALFANAGLPAVMLPLPANTRISSLGPGQMLTFSNPISVSAARHYSPGRYSFIILL